MPNDTLQTSPALRGELREASVAITGLIDNLDSLSPEARQGPPGAAVIQELIRSIRDLAYHWTPQPPPR